MDLQDRSQHRPGYAAQEKEGKHYRGTAGDTGRGPIPGLELRTVLNQLDDKSRTIILLRYFEDLKLEDIADIVGDNLNTVKARLYRSLKKLRLNLEAEHYREIPDKS